MKRKIIQIIKLNHFTLLAVCDDGTVWQSTKGKDQQQYLDWKLANRELIVDIPQL